MNNILGLQLAIWVLIWVKMKKPSNTEPVCFGIYILGCLLSSCNIKMGNPTNAVQWGGSHKQRVKNIKAQSVTFICSPFALSPKIQELG